MRKLTAEAVKMMTDMPLDKDIVSELFNALPELEKVLNSRTAEAVHGVCDSVI